MLRAKLRTASHAQILLFLMKNRQMFKSSSGAPRAYARGAPRITERITLPMAGRTGKGLPIVKPVSLGTTLKTKLFILVKSPATADGTHSIAGCLVLT